MKKQRNKFLVFLILLGIAGQAEGRGGGRHIRVFSNNPGAALGANHQAHYQQDIQSKAEDDREERENHGKKRSRRLPINPGLRKHQSHVDPGLNRTILEKKSLNQ